MENVNFIRNGRQNPSTSKLWRMNWKLTVTLLYGFNEESIIVSIWSSRLVFVHYSCDRLSKWLGTWPREKLQCFLFRSPKIMVFSFLSWTTVGWIVKKHQIFDVRCILHYFERLEDTMKNLNQKSRFRHFFSEFYLRKSFRKKIFLEIWKDDT